MTKKRKGKNTMRVSPKSSQYMIFQFLPNWYTRGTYAVVRTSAAFKKVQVKARLLGETSYIMRRKGIRRSRGAYKPNKNRQT